MPLMPMPPMPMKWIGPMSRGSFMADRSSRSSRSTRSASRSAASPAPCARAAAAIATSFCGALASALISTASRAGVKSSWGRRSAPPARRQHAGIGGLVLVERVRQRHQDRGPPDRRQLGHGGGAGARHHEMRGGDARRQVGEERRHLGGDPGPRVDLLDPRDVLLARLLHDRQAHLQMRLEPLDRGRHDVGHDAGALAAAEHHEAQRSGRSAARHKASSRRRSPPAAPDCRCASPWR